jgi:hypothetical protein
MGMELVTDGKPTGDFGIGGDHGLQMQQEIFLQLRNVSTLTPSSLAIWLLFFPSAAARIIRPRCANC